ncbi:MAG: hypothetical protein HY535_05510 [Chloroflexi bacterium]|nr:hypothetical protein [Chloroflexota bacterium]
MIPLRALAKATREALAYVRAQPGVREAEVFMASNGGLFARLNYTSHIPSNGLEEPKSLDSYGVGIRAAFNTPEGVKAGFGSEPSDISLEGVRRALEKARHGAVRDPEFVSLPRPGKERRTLRHYHDPVIMRMRDGHLVDAGWRVVEAALEAFGSSEELTEAAGTPEGIKALGLIVGGDMVALQERVAIASTHLPQVQTDESTLIMSFVTAMVEERFAKGTAWSAVAKLADFSGGPGAEAARNAILSMGGVRVPSRTYRVVLGRQPITELLNFVILPSFSLGTFYAGASAFQGKLGQQVAWQGLSLYDHGALPGLAASKGITDEGLPTGRTDIIKSGHLVGLLSHYYEYQRMLNDPKGREKLGVDPRAHQEAIAPRNGFRFARGGGRHFDTPPGTGATSIIIEGSAGLSREELFRLVGDGLYIGRIWYTYPINGIAAGDFTGTVVGDSYLIKDGRLAAPLKPNTLRLSDNIHNLLQSILGIGKKQQGTVVWAADSIMHVPEIAFASLNCIEIAEYMESAWAPGG